MKHPVRHFISLRILTLLYSVLTLSVGIAFGQAISGNVVGTITIQPEQ